MKGLNGDLMRRDEFARRESEIGLGAPEGQEDRKRSGDTVGVDGGLDSFFSFPTLRLPGVVPWACLVRAWAQACLCEGSS